MELFIFYFVLDRRCDVESTVVSIFNTHVSRSKTLFKLKGSSRWDRDNYMCRGQHFQRAQGFISLPKPWLNPDFLCSSFFLAFPFPIVQSRFSNFVWLYMVIFIESFCIIINTILYICSTEKWSGCICLKGGCIYRVSCLSSFTQSYTLSYKDIKTQRKYVLIASLGSQWISHESNPEQYLLYSKMPLASSSFRPHSLLAFCRI